MSEVKHGRGYVYAIQYHLVWCVKYRHKVLVGKVEDDIKKLLHAIALEHDVIICEMETDEDHIHLLVECKPQHYLPDIMKSLKGVSARLLFKLHPELKSRLWGGDISGTPAILWQQ